MRIINIIGKELLETIKRPARFLNLFNSDKRKSYARHRSLVLNTSDRWMRAENGTEASALESRKFESYEDYIALQKSKLGYLDLEQHEANFRKHLISRLKGFEWIESGTTVLCLAARLGAEVRAFRDLGCFAVGIDLNPGKDNPYVHYADFHALPYADGSVEVVYTNSLDHAFNIEKILAEVSRVLKQDGYFIMEADPGEQEIDEAASGGDLWQSLRWETTKAFSELICQHGYREIASASFDYPRGGTQYVYVRDQK